MLRQLAATTLAAVTLATAAAAQGAPSATIRNGTYDLEIAFGGGVLQGQLDIAVTGDSTAATLKVGDHPSPVRAAERKANRLVLVSTNPGMDVRYELAFQGDAVSGTFTYGGQSGTLTGRRRAATGH